MYQLFVVMSYDFAVNFSKTFLRHVDVNISFKNTVLRNPSIQFSVPYGK